LNYKIYAPLVKRKTDEILGKDPNVLILFQGNRLQGRKKNVIWIECAKDTIEDRLFS
jgi:hypothetical protein